MSDEDVTNGSEADGQLATSVTTQIDKANQNSSSNNTVSKDGHNDRQDANGSGDKKSDEDVKSRHASGDSVSSSEYDILDAESISEARVARVMREIRERHYSPATVEDSLGLLGECANLFMRDYNIKTVENQGGQLSYNYPAELIIPIGCKGTDIGNVEFNKLLYIKRVNEAAVARSRSRFVVPVILFDNKFICRGGTVGNSLTMSYETAIKPQAPRTEFMEETYLQQTSQNVVSMLSSAVSKTAAVCGVIASDNKDELLEYDADILRLLSVERISDLMVENVKMYLGALPVSSSEKMHGKVYEEFKIEQMPFPGCEFFQMYHNAGRKAEGLVFSWDSPEVLVKFKLCEDATASFPGIEWENLEVWDLIQLTKVYMKVLLTFIARDSGGLAIHCISGWDRTPLFISLLRVSLWADGVVHETLSTVEMAFLTLAYDWYLFGHNFPTRFGKNEEIMHFCLNFMQHMASDDFSVTRIFHELPPERKQNRSFPEFKAEERLNKVTEIRSLLLSVYEKEILNRAPEEIVVPTADESLEKVSMQSED